MPPVSWGSLRDLAGNCVQAHIGRSENIRDARLVVDQLFVEPTATVNGVAKSLNIQFSTARTLIEKLVKAGIVREVTGQARNRVFLAHGVVEVFSTDVSAPRERR